MKSRKGFALIISLVLAIGIVLPGTLALSTDQAATNGELTVTEETPTPTPEVTETPTPTEEPEPTETPVPSETTGNNLPVDPQPDATNGGTGTGAENGGSSEENSGKDPASMTDAELYAHVKQLTTDEEIEAFLKQLPEARVNALIAYAQAQEPTVVPKTEVFTDAGPFMPPVNVATWRKMLRARAATGVTADNGLELSKTATANGNDSYTIRMEAYTTGTVTTSTKTVPVDIVLVLDQSGSMAYDFNGKSLADRLGNIPNENIPKTRQYAMKQAVNNFIDKVNEKYTEEADHRMAIVTFNSGVSTLQGWTNVNEDGKGTLQNAINGLPVSPSGATNVAAGMEQAENLMGSGYSYAGTNTQRQKVVVVFTDGVPTTQTNFNVDVANGAISSANALKNSGVTIYSVGIFKGADPNKIHGDYYYRAVIADTPCDGSVNSYWGTTNLSSSNANDFADPDVPAGNRFLNYISNNYTAANIGLRFDGSDGVLGGYKWIITANYAGSNAGYYLTADNAAGLNSIFQTISDQIQTANIDLGNQTVVKDTVSPYFDAPADASGIELYTAAAKKGGSFEADVPASGVTATIENNAVTVTGFDFNANFVSDTAKSDGSYGKKLIIEFTVTPKDGFLGGNDVPTNDWENTAVYDKDGNLVEKFADATTTPTVNVPIDNVTVTATDKNVYLKGEVTADQLKDGAKISVGGVELDLSKATDTEKPYGLEAWQTKYVNITVEVKDNAGNVISDKLADLTDDTTYTVTVTVSPKTTVPTSTEGTKAKEQSGTNDPKAKINVFKPELTFKDSTAYYGENVPTSNDYSGNKVSEKWMHGNTVSTDADVTMFGDKPTLDITYAPDGSKLDNGKYTKQDVPVSATVKIGEENVNGYTAFLHQDCNPACGWTTPNPNNGDPAFLLHVKTCTLTITKQGGADGEPYVFDIYKDDDKYSEVTVKGNGTETLVELPVGTYTIKEDTGWSWRYSANNGGSAALTAQYPTGSITCTNTKTKDQWLNGFSNVEKNISDGSHNN